MKTLILSSSIFILLAFCACTPKIYLPTPQCAPLFGKQGEVQASGEIGSPLLNLQGAYAATNHLFIVGDATSSPTNIQLVATRFNMLELGGGYYTSTDNDLRFELQGGAGYGNRYGFGETYTGGFLAPPRHTVYIVNTDYNELYIQPAIGKSGDVFGFGFSSRFSYIAFPGFNYQVNYGYEDKRGWDPGNFWQPAAYCTVGFQNIYGIWQVGYSMPLTGPVLIYGNPVYSYLYFSAGLQVRLFNN